MSHPFESAGLGLAPFRFVAVSECRGPLTVAVAPGVEMQIGAPGQPMGVCDYCGAGIAICCHIKAADGRRFIVGSDCVAKIHREDNAPTDADQELAAEVRRGVRRLQLDREERRINAAFTRLDECGALQAALLAKPHGRGTALDYVQFCRTHAGHAGKLRVARMIEAADAPTT